MKVFITFLSICVVISNAAGEDYCYQDATQACTVTTKGEVNNLVNCNARYGAIEALLPDLQALTNTHISRSFEYLLMATHYGNYEKNREGFEKLFRELSDYKWDEAIDLIKYITKRGGKMNFDVVKNDNTNEKNGNYELYELESVAKALDMEKSIAEETHHIHGQATRKRQEYHDPEISSFLEKEFVHKQASIIRTLAGYATELSSLVRNSDSSLAVYLFDEYIKNRSII